MENLSLEASLIQTREVELASAEALGMEKGLEQGIQQGLEQGIEKGIEKGIQKVALRMLSQNLGLDVIAEMTGLTLDDIATLKAEMTRD
jgi:predicted transposase/invertase (TIGR01784 family)